MAPLLVDQQLYFNFNLAENITCRYWYGKFEIGLETYFVLESIIIIC